jgi:Transposase IS66 family
LGREVDLEVIRLSLEVIAVDRYDHAPAPAHRRHVAAEEAESIDLAPLAEGSSEAAAVKTKAEEAESSAPSPPQGGQGFGRRCAGKQPGAKGKTLTAGSLLATPSEHPKLKALAHEILKDWQAVVAFVSHPHLPVTKNEAERALRHAVIARHISHGTRSTEGSDAYATLLTVMETCRRRNRSPWPYLAEVIALLSLPMPQARTPGLG